MSAWGIREHCSMHLNHLRRHGPMHSRARVIPWFSLHALSLNQTQIRMVLNVTRSEVQQMALLRARSHPR